MMMVINTSILTFTWRMQVFLTSSFCTDNFTIGDGDQNIVEESH